MNIVAYKVCRVAKNSFGKYEYIYATTTRVILSVIVHWERRGEVTLCLDSFPLWSIWERVSKLNAFHFSTLNWGKGRGELMHWRIYSRRKSQQQQLNARTG
jgi:hypothetical protein